MTCRSQKKKKTWVLSKITSYPDTLQLFYQLSTEFFALSFTITHTQLTTSENLLLPLPLPFNRHIPVIIIRVMLHPVHSFYGCTSYHITSLALE